MILRSPFPPFFRCTWVLWSSSRLQTLLSWTGRWLASPWSAAKIWRWITVSCWRKTAGWRRSTRESSESKDEKKKGPMDSNVFTEDLTANVKLKWKIVLRCLVPVFYFFNCLVCMQALLAFWVMLPAVLTHNNHPVWHHHWSPLWEQRGFHPMLQTRLVIFGTNFRWFTCMSFILCFPDASSQITFSVQCFIWLFTDLRLHRVEASESFLLALRSQILRR